MNLKPIQWLQWRRQKDAILREVAELRLQAIAQKKQIKDLEHSLQVQRARTGDQKAMVKLLRERLIALGDVDDPVKTVKDMQKMVNAELSRQGILRQQERKKKRAEAKERIRKMVKAQGLEQQK